MEANVANVASDAPDPSQNELDYDVPVNRSAPDTARNNSMRKDPGRAGTQRRRVFDFIQQNGVNGATDQEGQAALGMQPGAYAARRKELTGQSKGCRWQFIANSGRTRPTPRGDDAIVWVALDEPIDTESSSVVKPSARDVLRRILRKCSDWCDDVDTTQPIDFICEMRDYVKEYLG